MKTKASKAKKKRPVSKRKVVLKEASPLASTDTHARHCCNCRGEVLSIKRSFSDQAWSTLVSWEEISPNAVNEAICEECYLELREVLIDRHDDLDLPIKKNQRVAS